MQRCARVIGCVRISVTPGCTPHHNTLSLSTGRAPIRQNKSYRRRRHLFCLFARRILPPSMTKEGRHRRRSSSSAPRGRWPERLVIGLHPLQGGRADDDLFFSFQPPTIAHTTTTAKQPSPHRSDVCFFTLLSRREWRRRRAEGLLSRVSGVGVPRCSAYDVATEHTLTLQRLLHLPSQQIRRLRQERPPNPGPGRDQQAHCNPPRQWRYAAHGQQQRDGRQQLRHSLYSLNLCSEVAPDPEALCRQHTWLRNRLRP